MTTKKRTSRKAAAAAYTPEQLQPRQHPLMNVQWIDPSLLYANEYNPNHVFNAEFSLLKTSIMEDGWTQPIVAHSDGQIVDGFHRWTLGRTDPDIRAISDSLVPVVFLPEQKTLSDRMFATVRHNRARGQHAVLKMSDIVKSLIEDGLSKQEICRRLEMDGEEFDRLSDVRTSPENRGKDSFGKGWISVPKRD